MLKAYRILKVRCQGVLKIHPLMVCVSQGDNTKGSGHSTQHAASGQPKSRARASTYIPAPWSTTASCWLPASPGCPSAVLRLQPHTNGSVYPNTGVTPASSTCSCTCRSICQGAAAGQALGHKQLVIASSSTTSQLTVYTPWTGTLCRAWLTGSNLVELGGRPTRLGGRPTGTVKPTAVRTC